MSKKYNHSRVNNSTEVILYGSPCSVYTRSVQLVLEEKEIAYRLENVDIFASKMAHDKQLLLHPFGKIPVLKHGDFMLYETNAIVRYIDESWPTLRLQPDGVRGRARMNQIIGIFDAYAYTSMVWDVYVQRIYIPAQGGRSDEKKVARGLARSQVCLSELEALHKNHDFLVDSRLTLADLYAYPMLQYLMLTAEGAQLMLKFSKVSHWFNNMSGRKSTLSLYRV